jgi:hypothetical protein
MAMTVASRETDGGAADIAFAISSASVFCCDWAALLVSIQESKHEFVGWVPEDGDDATTSSSQRLAKHI